MIIVGTARRRHFVKARARDLIDNFVFTVNASDDRNIQMVTYVNQINKTEFLDKCQARFNRKAMLDLEQPDAQLH